MAGMCLAGLWVSKICARSLPAIFQFLCGIVSSGTRKYALVLQALEIQLSLAGWALVGLATFMPIMTRNPDNIAKKTDTPQWNYIVNRVLAATLFASLIFLGERLFIQLLSINYHRKQFVSRIKQSKYNIHLISLLYDASRAMFPAYCPEFAEEDATISDSIITRNKKGHSRSGSTTPMRIIRDVGRFGDKLTSALGDVAQEVTGKHVFDPDSAHSVVVQALEKNRPSEALARRLWLSFVIEGHDAMYQEDVIEVLGAGRQVEAEECFSALDRDGNGNVSLDEMIMTVTECGRERYSIASSMHDVDQAINVLDRLLCTVVFVVVVFTFGTYEMSLCTFLFPRIDDHQLHS